MEIIDSNLKIIFQNPNIKSIVTLFLVLYASLARPKLPNFIKKLFKNIIFRIFILTLITYQSSRDTKFSLLLSVCFILTLDNISIEEFSETEQLEEETAEIKEYCDIVSCPEGKTNFLDKECKGDNCNELNCCAPLAKCKNVECPAGKTLDKTKFCSDQSKESCDETLCCVSNQKCTEITDKKFCPNGYKLISDDTIVCNSDKCKKDNDLYRCCIKENVSCKDMVNKSTCLPSQKIDPSKNCENGNLQKNVVQIYNLFLIILILLIKN